MKSVFSPLVWQALRLILVLIWISPVWAGHGPVKEPKQGILLVAFGSSQASAQVSFKHIEAKTRAAYPGVPVFWAYTSSTIRKKMADRGLILDAPQVALSRMADQGFTHVAVQSLHTIGGGDYGNLKRMVAGFESMGVFEAIALGDPLLFTQADMARAVDAIFSTLPKARKKDEAVVLMGHGTHHPANAFYAALMFQVQLRDPNIFIGTVEGFPALVDIQDLLLDRGVEMAWLMPLMSVAGEHVKNDMAGDGADSWKSLLTRSGISCRSIPKGMAEYDAFVSIWVDHIKDAMARL